jgi:hypothetical protein
MDDSMTLDDLDRIGPDAVAEDHQIEADKSRPRGASPGKVARSRKDEPHFCAGVNFALSFTGVY